MPRKNDSPEPGGGASPWTRGALVSLWLISVALLAGTLAVRWDALMTNLAGAPSASREGVER